MFRDLFKSVGDIAKGSAKVAKGVVTLDPDEVGDGVTTTASGAANTATLGLFREDEKDQGHPGKQKKQNLPEQKIPAKKTQNRENQQKSNYQPPKNNSLCAPSAPPMPEYSSENDNEALRKEVELLKKQLEAQRLLKQKQRLQAELLAEHKQPQENIADDADLDELEEGAVNPGLEGVHYTGDDNEAEEDATNAGHESNDEGIQQTRPGMRRR